MQLSYRLRQTEERARRIERELTATHPVRRLIQMAAPEHAEGHRPALKWCNLCLFSAIAFIVLAVVTAASSALFAAAAPFFGFFTIIALLGFLLAGALSYLDSKAEDQLVSQLESVRQEASSLRDRVTEHHHHAEADRDERRRLAQELDVGSSFAISIPAGPEVLMAAIVNYWTTQGWVQTAGEGKETETPYVKFFRGQIGMAACTIRVAVQVRPQQCNVLLSQRLERTARRTSDLPMLWRAYKADFESFLRDWAQAGN